MSLPETLAPPVVAYCYTPQGRVEAVHRALQQQWPLIRWCAQDPDDPAAYADTFRQLWREPGDLVLVEQDKLPPPDGIPALLSCACEWGGFPHEVAGRRWKAGTGVVKYRARLRRRHPDLADLAFSGSDQRWAVLAGLTALPPAAALDPGNRKARTACIRKDAPPHAGTFNPAARPTVYRWPVFDTRIQSALQAAGESWHEHFPPALHLHQG